MGTPTEMDFGGLTLVCKNVKVGATSPGASGSGDQIVRHTTGATLSLTAAQSGGTIYLDKADGVVITLPAASVGLSYRFVVVTSVTSNAYKLSTATQGTEFFDGTINSLQDSAVASAVFSGDGSTTDNFSMNGTTTGGLVGTMIRVSCTVANKWTVDGFVRASGTEATPFSTT